MGNLDLWSAVEKTDPAHTKEYSGTGGFSGTAVNATYLVRKATEAWGPCGAGWGYNVLEDRFDQGGPLESKDGEPTVFAQIHTIKLELWYLGADGERKSVTHYGHTPFVFRNKHGIQTDGEAPKKSLTDALKKCLSMLGFAGDIHLGLFDDIHYVSEVRAEADIERATNKVEEKERQLAEYHDWLKQNVELITSSVHLNELSKLYKSAMRKVSIRGDEKAQRRLTQAMEERKAYLEQQKKDNAA